MDQSKRKDSEKEIEWVLPASIPFSELKGRDLEECIYWLFDALGAKDLEWRIGGSGGGTADGGRDLEAHFFAPTIDDEVEPKIWWIECKGRSGTVEKAEVQDACNNSLVREDLDYLVIVTNTQFSNPTRDWVKEWQKQHKKPKVKLWDKEHLERLLSRHPSVVLRLFSDALSIQGRVQAMEARFWNRLEYSPPGLLADIWKERKNLEFSQMSLFAAIASEFSNGKITERPWGAVFDAESLITTLHLTFANVAYLVLKSMESGTDRYPIIRAASYLMMSALQYMEPDEVAKLVRVSLYRGEEPLPEDVQALLLMPIVDQIFSELQDVCSDDCTRMSAMKNARLAQSSDEIEAYWQRFKSTDSKPKDDNDGRRLLLENTKAPCKVGFPVGPEKSCPLFGVEPTMKNLAEVMSIAKRVIHFRKSQIIEREGVERHVRI